MELDDLKSDWEKAGRPVETGASLQPSMIDAMIRQKYRSQLHKITYPEITGNIICIASAVFIVLDFGKFDSLFFQVTGILTVIILLLLSVISFISIRRLSFAGDPGKPYGETLKQFAIQRIRFHQLQRLNMLLSYLLMVTTVILLPKLFGGKNIAESRSFWLFAFCLGYIVLAFFSRRVARYYTSTLKQAEELLNELKA